MIVIDPANQTDRENYKLLIGSIVPRPIALVTSLSKDGVLNAAPFSYFSIVASQPPMISISVQRKQGVMKDTARNANDAGAFVVHIVDESNVRAANQAAASLPPNVSELESAGLTPVASDAITVPGIMEAKIRMECVLERSISLGGNEKEAACDLLIGRVVRFHFADEIFDKGHILADKLNPVSRMAGNHYAALGEQFSLDRPL
ncbi:flavin reductase family protein [Paenibacillus montanisoli]|uniref:Flavin reductase family protein n=1 Tax=Paenibacillus montanisoli TaxID=2081970 RepID=A0A328TZC0_9BACL|nr:flavin reductase family protein [Paenibacillus montanisoli]RAP75779.1 flavin reductase family protein [Paenibacillus montanisoli]